MRYCIYLLKSYIDNEGRSKTRTSITVKTTVAFDPMTVALMRRAYGSLVFSPLIVCYFSTSNMANFWIQRANPHVLTAPTITSRVIMIRANMHFSI